MLARVGASLRKAASLFNGMPDELPAVRSIARFDGAFGGAYAATVHTDREWGGRSRATFRVGNPGASGSPVCAVFEGFIDKRPSDVGVAGGDRLCSIAALRFGAIHARRAAATAGQFLDADQVQWAGVHGSAPQPQRKRPLRACVRWLRGVQTVGAV